MFSFLIPKKRIYIEPGSVLCNKSFLIWFTMTNFPEGLSQDEDSLYDIMEDKYDRDIEEDYINDLTGYYDDVFEKTDGHIKTPKTIQMDLATGDKWYIEFHPGDNVYYFNKKKLGSTGPEYSIQKISFWDFQKYTKDKTLPEKLLVMPMVRVSEAEKASFSELVYSVIREISYVSSDIDGICQCIADNCTEKKEHLP